MVDTHQHCACNGVTLCAECHRYVHANPAKARESGLIVSSFVGEPSTIPVQTYRGWTIHTCGGGRETFPATTAHSK